MLKRTPLFAAHQKAGAKLVEFGGWEMPVYYTSIMDEHLAVRSAAGLFDISHMGEVLVAGAAAGTFLNATLTNDIRKLAPGQGQYTLMCNERGGVIDDLYAYRLAEEKFLLIINASRIDADWAWLQARQSTGYGQAGVELENVSDAWGAVALQGPRTPEFIDACFPRVSASSPQPKPARELKKNELGEYDFDGVQTWVSRTGYTGEDGFEIVAPASHIERVWDKLLELGQPFGLKPAGLGARDTLRTEQCYPLYGHELDENTTPVEAGLAFFVSFDKDEFTGRAALLEQKIKGVAKKCVAFKMIGKSAPPRPHYSIWSASATVGKIGEVVSGTQSPSLAIGIGMGYVPAAFAAPGTQIEIEIRNQRAPAVITPKPIYRKKT